MPCRCCRSYNKPSKGLGEPREKQINEHLIKAAKLIDDEKYYVDDNQDKDLWINGWIEAFTHHLKGCPEGNKDQQ